jgi:transposase
MKLHANAALSLNRRRLLVQRVGEEGWSLAEAAKAAEVSEPTARKWVARFLAEGEAGLLDRPSAACRVHNRTPEDRVQAICALRRLRFTGAEIAEILEMPETTVSGILTRCGLGRLGRLGLEPARRYERSRPGELVHVDVKKLGRISKRGAGHRAFGRRSRSSQFKRKGKGVTGWEFVHVCVDDATRLAYAEVLGDERATTAAAFLRRALRFFARHGVQVEGVIDRQRLGLPLGGARARLPSPRPQASAHPALPAADQRKGRALHPHPARRMGLWRDLRQRARTDGSTRGLALALQLPAQAWRPWPKATGSSARRAKQPARVLQLGQVRRLVSARCCAHYRRDESERHPTARLRLQARPLEADRGRLSAGYARWLDMSLATTHG